jgi:hypothetical protein
MKIPKEIIDKINLTEEEFENIDVKIQLCIIRLASENVILHNKISDSKVSLINNIDIILTARAISKDHMLLLSKNNCRIILIRDDTCDENGDKSLRVFIDKELFGYVDKYSLKELRKYDIFKYDLTDIRVVKRYGNVVELIIKPSNN